MNWDEFVAGLPWATALELGGKLLVIVFVTLVVLAFISRAIHATLVRVFEREVEEGASADVSAIELQRRRDTLEGLLNRWLRLLIIVIALLMVLAVVGFDITPALAGLGLAGLALGLGAQNLVRDYVAGIFVLIENHYARGDVVSIAGVSGLVEGVSLRRTTLRDLSGTVHNVPNGLIQTSSNLTRTWSRINLDLPVPFGTPYEQAKRLIDEVGERFAAQPEWKARVIAAPKVVRIDLIGESGLVFKVLGDVVAGEQWAAAGELRRLIIDAFAGEGLALGTRGISDVVLQHSEGEKQA